MTSTAQQQPTAGATTIAAFLCPSDGNKVARPGSSYNGLDFGDTNYYNNLGTLLSLHGGTFDGPAYIMGSIYGPTVTLASIHGRDLKHRDLQRELDGQRLVRHDLQFRPGVCRARGRSTS